MDTIANENALFRMMAYFSNKPLFVLYQFPITALALRKYTRVVYTRPDSGLEANLSKEEKLFCMEIIFDITLEASTAVSLSGAYYIKIFLPSYSHEF